MAEELKPRELRERMRERVSLFTTDDEEREAALHNVLSITYLREYNVLLSWGGPSDGFKLYWDPESGEWVRGVYWYADWGTYQETGLEDSEIDALVEAVGIYPEEES